jgi:DUF438 domain-containing protein
MHAIDLLEQQHQQVSHLFEQARGSSGAERVRLIGEMTEALTVHAGLEERYFYPLVSDYGLNEAASHGMQEHDEVKELLAKLMKATQHTPEVDRLLEKLEHSVTHHVKEEEEEIFVWLKGRVEQEELESVGEEMERAAEDFLQKHLLKLAEQKLTPADSL